MSAIEIFSSVKKYGPLSNNYKHNMIINKELWNSVTQFVYTLAQVLQGSTQAFYI